MIGAIHDMAGILFGVVDAMGEPPSDIEAGAATGAGLRGAEIADMTDVWDRGGVG
eukprot:gene11498-11595_t